MADAVKRMRRLWERFLAAHTRLDRRHYKLVRVTVEYGHRYLNLHFRGCHADDHEVERIRFERSRVAYEIRCFKDKRGEVWVKENLPVERT